MVNPHAGPIAIPKSIQNPRFGSREEEMRHPANRNNNKDAKDLANFQLRDLQTVILFLDAQTAVDPGCPRLLLLHA